MFETTEMDDFCKMVMDLLTELRADQKTMVEKMEIRQRQVDEISRKLDEHATESNHRHSQILGAFPAQDTEGHRRYHESEIEWRELRNRMIRETLVNCAKTAGLTSAGWLAYAIWIAIKAEFTR